MKKIYLSSVGYIVLSFLLSMILLFVMILLLYFNGFDLFYFLINFLCLSFTSFAFFICLKHKIIINNNILILWNFKKIIIPINQIIDIYMDYSVSNYNIIFIKTKNDVYKISGKSTLFGRKRNLIETQKIVDEINELIINAS